MASDTFTFSRKLFETSNGTPMTFHIVNCVDEEGELTAMIEYGGGMIETLEDPSIYAITLAKSVDVNSTTNRDVFKPKFIWHCCIKNKIVPLKMFRLNEKSAFHEDFDPNEVLFHNISWPNAEKKWLKKTIGKPHSKPTLEVKIQKQNPIHGESLCSHEEQTLEEDLSCTSISSEHSENQPTSSSGPQPKQQQMKRRQKFTENERKLVVEYIANSGRFGELKGKLLWQRMSRKLSRHTWQSLKEHFFKKIFPSLDDYGLSKDILKLIKAGAGPNLDEKSSMHSTQSNRSRGPPYSSKEDKLILKYVYKKATETDPLAGNEFWKKMQHERALPGRTWQAVRERYLKHLKHLKYSDEHTNSYGSSKSEANKNSREKISPHKQSPESCSDGGGHQVRLGRLGVSEDKEKPKRKRKHDNRFSLEQTENQSLSKDGDERVQIAKKNQSENISSSETEGNCSKTPPKKRKLHSAVNSYVLHAESSPLRTPVSVKIKGPSLLDRQVKNVESQRMAWRKRLHKTLGANLLKSSTEIHTSGVLTSLKDKKDLNDIPIMSKENSPSSKSLGSLRKQLELEENQHNLELIGQESDSEPAVTQVALDAQECQESAVHSVPLTEFNNSHSKEANKSEAIVLPEWPDNFKVDEIVFVECESKAYSEGDSNETSGGSSDESHWSDDPISMLQSSRPYLQEEREQVSKNVVNPPGSTCADRVEGALPSSRSVPNIVKEPLRGQVANTTEENHDETFDFIQDLTQVGTDLSIVSRVSSLCARNNKPGGKQKLKSESKQSDCVLNQSEESFNFDKDAFNFPSDCTDEESAILLVTQPCQTVTVCTQTVLKVNNSVQTDPVEIQDDLEESLCSSIESTPVAMSNGSPIRANRSILNLNQAKRRTRSISSSPGSVGVPSPKFSM